MNAQIVNNYERIAYDIMKRFITLIDDKVTGDGLSLRASLSYSQVDLTPRTDNNEIYKTIKEAILQVFEEEGIQCSRSKLDAIIDLYATDIIAICHDLANGSPAEYLIQVFKVSALRSIVQALWKIAPGLDTDKSVERLNMTIQAMYDEVYEIILGEIQSPDYDIGEVLKKIFKKIGIPLADLKADTVSTFIVELYDAILTVTREYVRSSIDRFLEESQTGTPKREDYPLNQDLFVEVISVLDDFDLIDTAEPEDFYGFCVIVQRFQRRGRLGRVKKIRSALTFPGEGTSGYLYNFIHSVLKLRGD